MRGFHPAAVEQHFVDGGVVNFLKRATGLAPKLSYPETEAYDRQRAQQRAQTIKSLPGQKDAAAAPQEPSGIGALPADYLRNPKSVLRKREQEAGFKDGGRVRPQGFVASDKHPDGIDTVPARLSKGEYVLPTDTVDAVGVENLDALRAATHTQARGFSGKKDGEFFFAGGGGVDDEERKRGNPGLTTVDDPVANAARFVKVPPPIGTQPGRQDQAQQPPAQPAPVMPPAVQPAAPAPEVQRQSVAAPVASGQPAATAPQPRPRTFTEDVIMTAGDNAKAAWDRGGASGVGEAFGHAVRGAATAIPAAFVDAADDVVNGPIGNTVGGFWRGITGGSDQPTQQPAAASPQASINGAQPDASPAASRHSPPLVSAEEQQRRMNAISGQAAAPAAGGGQEIMPGVFNHGRGQYSDNAAGMGFASGFTGQPNAQNMAAADALAARSQQESRGRVAAAQAAQAQQPQGFQAPVAQHSGNNWQRRNDLRNLEVSAGSITNNGSRWDKHKGESPASQAYRAALVADLQAQNMQPGIDVATMKENAGLQRTGMEQSGANQRAADGNALGRDRLALDTRRFGLDAQAKGFDMRQAQRHENLMTAYDKATHEQRAAMREQYPDIFKRGGEAKLQVLRGRADPATGQIDPDMVVSLDPRTQSARTIPIQGQAPKLQPLPEKDKRVAGQTYLNSNGVPVVVAPDGKVLAVQ
ncbi:MAG: hypothetical protein WC322_00205 [Candidatus Paceibacterota bacterium]|jgi:hypothetical protein